MRRGRVLNPGAADAGRAGAAEVHHEPVALSQRILAAARELEGPGQCAELDPLTAQLHAVRFESIEADAPRIAFWVNLYNALVLHCLCLEPLRGSMLRHLRLFDRVAYRVGGHEYPPNLIENGLLRRNRRAPLRPRRPLRPRDPRLAAAPGRFDRRIHFALNCGARSCPPIRTYDAEGLDAQLELATHAYMRAETRVDLRGRRVILPRLLRIYRRDFGDRRQQLELAARHVPELAELLGDGADSIRVAYARFDWTVAR